MDRLLHAVNTTALWIGGVSILGITLLGSADVLSTLLLGQPVHAVYEGTQTLMVMAVFLGLGMVHLHRSYVSVDLGYDRLPSAGKRISELATLLLMLFFFGALAWRGWAQALDSWRIGEYSAGIIAFPIYPARFALAIGSTLAIVCCLTDLVQGARFRRPRDLPARKEGELSAS
jgi:TRAP-type C4-dicarboxylate transport system permease small subunit